MSEAEMQCGDFTRHAHHVIRLRRRAIRAEVVGHERNTRRRHVAVGFGQQLETFRPCGTLVGRREVHGEIDDCRAADVQPGPLICRDGLVDALQRQPDGLVGELQIDLSVICSFTEFSSQFCTCASMICKLYTLATLPPWAAHSDKELGNVTPDGTRK